MMIPPPENLGEAGDLFAQGLEFQYQDQNAQAYDCFVRALALNDNAVTRSHLAIALRHDGAFVTAFKYLTESLERFPLNPWLLFQRALTLLQLKRWRDGWRDYEIRCNSPGHPSRPIRLTRWTGEFPAHDLLIYSEQGVGDEIMFASCIPDVLENASGPVYMESSERCASLFRASFPRLKVFTKGEPCPGSPVAEIPIGSLPRLYRDETEFFPRRAYLSAGAVARDARRYVGLSWRGGLKETRRAARSIDPNYLIPVAMQMKARIVSLQWDAKFDEIQTLEKRFGVKIYHEPGVFTDMLEFARLIRSCDSVISVCGANVHLSGALGVPVSCLTPFVPEWRYGLADVAMPWYPSVSLYRQDKTRHWLPVLERLAVDALS